MKRITKAEKEIKIDPKVKDILKLLASGVILSAVVLFPGIAAVGPFIEKQKRIHEHKQWEKFNLWRLRQIIKRLEKQKDVRIMDDFVILTDKGRKKLLRFDIENMQIRKKTDGKWRLIIYDVSELKKGQRELFRAVLKRFRFLQLQKSVYLTPFVCDDEIEYLKNIFDIAKDVKLIKVSGLENEIVYKKYFGL